MNRSLQAIGAALFLLCSAAAGAQQGREWPRLPEPDHLTSFEVGSQIMLSGVPVRIKGYVSDHSVPALIQWYRQNSEGRWVENKIGNKTVLGQRQGAFFATIEFEAMLGGLSGSTTKVVTSVMDLRAAAMRPSLAKDAFQNWSSRLPLTSKVLSHMADSTQTHDSLHLVAVNNQGLAYNVQHFRSEFRQMGYREESGSATVDVRNASAKPATGVQEKLSFSGLNTDALVVLGRNESGQSTMVLILHRNKR